MYLTLLKDTVGIMGLLTISRQYKQGNRRKKIKLKLRMFSSMPCYSLLKLTLGCRT